MMTRFISYTRKLLVRIVSLTALAGLTASCEKFFDYEGDCDPHYFVSFVYDMNMLYADAFSSQVSSVDLYVFDAATGRFVDHFAEQGEPLKEKGYMMPVDLQPGKYRFVAWCGLANNEGNFTVPATVDSIEELTAVMSRLHDDNGAYSNANLNFNSNGEPCALYHGIETYTLTDQQGTHVYPVALTKDTNNIIISIWHRYGELDPSHYEFRAVYSNESNASMNFDNSMLDDEAVTYRPWSLVSGDLDLGDIIPAVRADLDYENPQGRFIKSEIATARLMENHSPRIIIYDTEARETRLDLDLVRYIKMMRSENYRTMADQEYLDRQDEYSIDIILDSTWVGFQLVINGWHVIENDYVN